MSAACRIEKSLPHASRASFSIDALPSLDVACVRRNGKRLRAAVHVRKNGHLDHVLSLKGIPIHDNVQRGTEDADDELMKSPGSTQSSPCCLFANVAGIVLLTSDE